MTWAMGERIGISRQRGFWLRCFLGGTIVLLGVNVQAQVDCMVQPAIHVSQARGRVFDLTGVPIPNVAITLTREGQVVSTTTTLEDGGFAFIAPAGKYELEMNAEGFGHSTLYLQSGTDMVSLVHRGQLQVILGLPFLNCTWGTTSKRKFDREVQQGRDRLRERAQHNGTQN
ncbi:MAG TPA: carboxypeptidase-like regulatory domain-containing protein [Terracidiphilus sp.]|jgi:hypothetical protein